jgi:hypothetical protein
MVFVVRDNSIRAVRDLVKNQVNSFAKEAENWVSCFSVIEHGDSIIYRQFLTI